jgi:hypothetical protein
MTAGSDHTAVRALGFDGALDVDPALSEAQDLCFQDTIVRQVEDGGGTIGG